MHGHKTPVHSNSWHCFGSLQSHVGFVLVFPASSLLAGSSSREDLWHFAESFRYWFPLEHLLLCEMIEATSRLSPWMFAAAAQLIICYIYLNSKKKHLDFNLPCPYLSLYLLPGRLGDPAASPAGVFRPLGKNPLLKFTLEATSRENKPINQPHLSSHS